MVRMMRDGHVMTSKFSVPTFQRFCLDRGFDMVGITDAHARRTGDFFVAWLGNDMFGEMAWMERSPSRRVDPRNVLKNAQSIISLGASYHISDIPENLVNDPSRGIIARYALLDDYHDVLQPYIKDIVRELRRHYPAANVKYYIDTGPVLERDVAQSAGLGFIGRNSNLIHPRYGSYVFLAEILIDTKLPATPKGTSGTCGRCDRCMRACPTNAIVADRTIDARKCISYLTIELRGSVPEALRPLMGNRIYGCDICQEVCPWNKKAATVRRRIFHLREDLVAPKLSDLAFLTEEGFRDMFRKSPVKRTKYHGLLRNVAVALGNWRSPDAKKPLQHLARHHHALVREHAQWALRHNDFT